MKKYVNKNKAILRYMEALELQTGTSTVHWEENTSFISAVEAKIVTPRVKHIDITVCFLQEKIDNGLFIPKHNKYSIITEDMRTKPWSGPIIGRSNT